MEYKKFPALAYNPLSIAGALIALTALLAIVFIFAVTLLTRTANPYVGIILYLVLPVFLVLGALMVPAGMYRVWRRMKRGEEFYPKWPSIDLNVRQERNAAMLFITGAAVFVLLNSVGVYKTYQFTESVAFCGLVCHRVMEPQYTAYKLSPHSSLKCVQCHIGPGAGWYTRSKLSGLYQVYAVLANRYPRPIPAPIKNLRPVEIDCERCHWPGAFSGSRLISFVHYLYDKANTRWTVDLLFNTGGANPDGPGLGIHWHMNPDVRVEFIATDRQWQDIPWVRFTDLKTGRVTVYQDVTHPLPEKAVLASKKRVMDCVDCHNVPSHHFHSPDHAIDAALACGRIDASIPEIKRVAVEAMVKRYNSRPEAMKMIASAIRGFYKNRYPAFYAGRRALIERAIAATRREYSENIFPDMRVRWSEYPDNAGHFIFPGCMRCHDGKHKSRGGGVIPNGCHTCHIILSQGRGKSFETVRCPDLRRGERFEHPVNIAGAWKTVPCYECHTGRRP